jgi:hypothetical protein
MPAERRGGSIGREWARSKCRRHRTLRARANRAMIEAVFRLGRNRHLLCVIVCAALERGALIAAARGHCA